MVYIIGTVTGVLTEIKGNTVTLFNTRHLGTAKVNSVPSEIIDSIAEGEIVTFDIYINAYDRKGQQYLTLTFKDVLPND